MLNSVDPPMVAGMIAYEQRSRHFAYTAAGAPSDAFNHACTYRCPGTSSSPGLRNMVFASFVLFVEGPGDYHVFSAIRLRHLQMPALDTHEQFVNFWSGVHIQL
jgi:hypothetical protein